jgi:class 3 adenylate cyclase/tetratricopeptide (TPR) repeat protein
MTSPGRRLDPDSGATKELRPELSEPSPTREELEQSIAALEAQRHLLGDAAAPALAALRSQLEAISSDSSETEDQRKHITILFADVQGFTAMSGQMDPEDVADVMNSLWARIDQVIIDHGGRVDKHIGDAVMALFGAPVAREDDPERAVAAALEMQGTIREEIERRGAEVASLQMRVGVNTGLAMLGNVGSTNEYTAIGHTVNLASRLEGLAPAGGVLISRSTMNQVVGLFNVEATDPMSVKGIEGPVTAFLVKSAKPRMFRVGPREVAGVPTSMVGRDDEIASLKALLPPSPFDTSGTVNLVTIIGGPGVGKSRLVYEYFNHLEANPHPVWLFRGRAFDSSRDTAYAVLRSILNDRFLIADSDPAETARQKLEDGLAEYMGEDAANAAPFLGHLIGLDYTNHPAVSGLLSEPKLIRDKGFRAFVRFLLNGCVGRYLVFLIEDIHWADQESLDFLEFLATELSDAPTVIMCTARPDLIRRRPEWDRDRPDHLIIRLEPLDGEAVDKMIEDVLQRFASPPDQLKTLIAERSEGNPFFLEELVKMLIDEGVIDVSGVEWTVKLDALNQTRIPDTLTGVLQARMDALPRSERNVLQRSSVIGRVFWEQAADHLAAAAGANDVELMRAVAPSLKQHELAYERDPSAFEFTREYVFKHAILHDVAYESVVRRMRRIYHKEVAVWLIEASGNRREEFAGQIADHYDRAGESDEAIDWLITAGDRARKTHAPDAAARAYGRAIEIARTFEEDGLSERALAALWGLGEVLTMQARYEEAIETYRKLRDDAIEAGDDGVLARAELGIATAETHRRRPREAVESARRSREAAKRGEMRADEARALFVEAWSSIRLGAFEEGVQKAIEVLAISREVGDPSQLAEALNLQGVISASTGSYDQAIADFSEAAAIYETAGNEEKLMPILNNLGVIAELRGDHEDAEKRYSEALAMARETNDRDAELVYLSNLGGTLVALGRPVEAEAMLREVISLSPEKSMLSEAYQFLTGALTAQERFEDALRAGSVSLDLAITSESPDDIAGAWRVLGTLASETGGVVEINDGLGAGVYEADDLFGRSLEVSEEIESDADRAKALTAWAIHDRQNGRFTASLERWAQAKELLEALGATSTIQRAESILSR